MASLSNRVFIVMSHPWPASNSVANRVTSFVVATRDQYRVTVISPEGSGYRPDWVIQHTVKHVKAHEGGGKLKRLYSELVQTVRLIRAMRTNCGKDSLVVLTIPSIFVLAGVFFAKGRVIADVRDLVWEYVARLRLGWVVAPILRFFVKRALVRSDAVLVTNPYERRYMQERLGIQCAMATNGIERQQVEELGFMLGGRERSDRECLQMLYLGNLGSAQNIPDLVRIVSRLDAVELHIVGSGNDQRRIQEVCKKQNVPNVVLHGAVTRDQVGAWYSQADVLVAQLAPAFHYAVPSKLYEYLATGKPILYIGTGAAVDFLRRFEGVVISESWQENSIIDAIGSVTRLVGKDFTQTRQAQLLDKYTREASARCFVNTLAYVMEKSH